MHTMDAASHGEGPAGTRERVYEAVPVASREDPGSRPRRASKRLRRLASWGGLTGAALIGAMTIFVSIEPDPFDVAEQTQALTGRADSERVQGTHTVSALLGVIDQLLEKPGGYLRNDVLPPFSIIDNMPSWEQGVITEVRDTIRALRDDFSRAQTQSSEDADLARADAQLHFDAQSWILPATEDEFAKGRAALQRYLDRLGARGSDTARFHARADNLNFYLATVEKRLGAYAQRLAGSAGSWQAPTWLGGAPTPSDPDYVSWFEADNVFFEARGYTWALLHTLRGVEHDFEGLLEAKEALLPLRQIIAKLERTQAQVWSPVIMNNSGFGLLTNHSLVMTSYISRANAAIIDFRRLLAEG